MNMETGLTDLNNLATLGEGLCGAGGKWGQIFILGFAIVVSSIKKLVRIFLGETFRILREKDEKQYGEYRTRRLVLKHGIVRRIAADREEAPLDYGFNATMFFASDRKKSINMRLYFLLEWIEFNLPFHKSLHRRSKGAEDWPKKLQFLVYSFLNHCRGHHGSHTRHISEHDLRGYLSATP